MTTFTDSRQPTPGFSRYPGATSSAVTPNSDHAVKEVLELGAYGRSTAIYWLNSLWAFVV
jgi:hypothetical protein